MRWHLDSDFCIAGMRRGGESIKARVESRPEGSVFISTIAYGELLLGAEKSDRETEVRAKVKGFVAPYPLVLPNRTVAAEYARIRANLEKRGTPIGSNDTWIAATALVHGATLITGNVDEFSRVDGLKIENWREPFPPRAG